MALNSAVTVDGGEIRRAQAARLRTVRGALALGDAPVSGYEIHAGATKGQALARPAVRLESHDDAQGCGSVAEGRTPEATDRALSDDGQILGTYAALVRAQTPRIIPLCAKPASSDWPMLSSHIST